MSSQLSRWLLTASLAAGTLLSVTASADPDVRDHRHGHHDHDKDRRDAGPPREAPPTPKEERAANRRGFVWVSGNWDWQNGQWAWVNGHYEKEQRGKHWRNHRWEK